MTNLTIQIFGSKQPFLFQFLQVRVFQFVEGDFSGAEFGFIDVVGSPSKSEGISQNSRYPFWYLLFFCYRDRDSNPSSSGADSCIFCKNRYNICIITDVARILSDEKGTKKLGWDPLLGNLADVLPGILIGGDIYKNRDKRLPDAPGRLWYEADFDYEGGYRNHCRLLYSNDGLLFVTCDHYLTFQEIVLEVIE